MKGDVPPFTPSAAPGAYLYEQVAAHIAARIAAGRLAPGARLPAEPDLAAEYGVAYHTIRGAVRVLRERGLVVTMHGRGNFIAGQPEAPPPGSDGDGASGDQGG